MTTESELDEPTTGDVLITTEHDAHFVSVVPQTHRIKFTHLPHAMNIALNWAAANGSRVWRTTDARTFLLK